MSALLPKADIGTQPRHVRFVPKADSCSAKKPLIRSHPNGCWRDCFKPYPIGEELERHQFEHILTQRTERIEKLEVVNRRLTSSRKAIIAGEAASRAIGALVTIMSDSTLPIRRRLQAADGLLTYKSPPDVAESAKVFLTSIFTDPEQNIDHRLAAITALRRSEDARIMPPIERPPPARGDTTEELPIPLLELVQQRRERQERMEREREMAMSDEHQHSDKLNSNIPGDC